MKKLNLYLSVIVSAIIAAVLFVTAAVAQDPSTMAIQAAQQASDQAMQAAQQANQQAMQMQQQAVQQATQQAQQFAQQAAQDASSSSYYIPPPLVPPPFPLQPTGPVPAAIAAAHNIMLTTINVSPNFPLDPGQVYNDVFADLQAWGHYKLVSTPQEADLIFELREVAPRSEIYGGHGYVYSAHSPAFLLTIVDPKSQLALWTITSPVYLAGKNQVYAHWVSLAESNLVSRIKVVAGQPLNSAEQADLTTVPKNHYGRNAMIATSAVLALGIGAGLIAHHEFENSLANAKKQQDAFCIANHIPLNECAGG